MGMSRHALRGLLLGCLAVLLPASLPAQDPARSAGAELREAALVLFGAVGATPAAEVEAPRARLGRALFWDVRLSATGEVACASCHFRENWGSDSRVKSIDARGRPSSRQSQTVFHAMEATGLRWLADRASGAAQAESSITGSMGFARAADILPVLRRHGYEAAFREAFPGEADPVTPANYALALEVYQATLRTPAPFDAWLRGDDRAMEEAQLRGLSRFISAGCVGCHNGPLVGGRVMQRFGLVEDYWRQTGSAAVDQGLVALTRQEADRFVFRVPLLRNIAETAPYFHDGSVESLAQATRIMARVQLGLELEEAAVEELVAFQRALTGDMPAHFSPPPGVPFALPPGVTPAAGR
jgi:cytochrome c peroxidase